MKAMQYNSFGLVGPKLIEGQYLNLDGKSNLTFIDITFSHCGQLRGELAKKIRFIRCGFLHLSPENEKAVQLFPGNDDWSFESCFAQYTGDFIYSNYLQNDHEQDGAQRITVKNCKGSFIGTTKTNPSRDGHFVGLQGGSNHTITGNVTSETGTAIELWARVGMPMRNCTVNNNYIRVTHALANENGSGIKFSGEPDTTAGLRTGNVCRDNNIKNCDGYGISSNWHDEIAGLTSNRIKNCKLGNFRITGM
jgi:hypothetical protein